MNPTDEKQSSDIGTETEITALRRQAEELTEQYRQEGEPDFNEAMRRLIVTQKEAEKREEKTIELWRQVAELGDADAQYQLGKWYHSRGWDSRPEAVQWFRKAAEQGHADAQYQLGQCYFYAGVFSKEDVTIEDKIEAVKWYRKAAEQNHYMAPYTLGRCYIHGWGVPQDIEEVEKWLGKAAEMRRDEAVDILTVIDIMRKQREK